MISTEAASSTTSWAKRDVSGPASRPGATITRSSYRSSHAAHAANAARAKVRLSGLERSMPGISAAARCNLSRERPAAAGRSRSQLVLLAVPADLRLEDVQAEVAVAAEDVLVAVDLVDLDAPEVAPA